MWIYTCLYFIIYSFRLLNWQMCLLVSKIIETLFANTNLSWCVNFSSSLKLMSQSLAPRFHPPPGTLGIRHTGNFNPKLGYFYFCCKWNWYGKSPYFNKNVISFIYWWLIIIYWWLIINCISQNINLNCCLVLNLAKRFFHLLWN